MPKFNLAHALVTKLLHIKNLGISRVALQEFSWGTKWTGNIGILFDSDFGTIYIALQEDTHLFTAEEAWKPMLLNQQKWRKCFHMVYYYHLF